ncbi:putative quinol monooxygenase [Shinella zoogloeoides]|uniref:putative quinol monooxygenase n=1 Tax=Shinella zoogloeoides TaxID=352475 RepID=UPI000E65B44D|nr:antibiotic biosynthesis monooxygenase [Shinella zoogloeoides]
MAVTIVETVSARPESWHELAALPGEQVAPTRAEMGCINYDFHVDVAGPRVRALLNRATQADLDTRLAMPHLLPLLPQIDRLPQDRSRFAIFICSSV